MIIFFICCVLYAIQLLVVHSMLFFDSGDFNSKLHFLFYNIPIIPILYITIFIIKKGIAEFMNLPFKSEKPEESHD